MDNTQMTLETQDSLIISNALRTLSLLSSPPSILESVNFPILQITILQSAHSSPAGMMMWTI